MATPQEVQILSRTEIARHVGPVLLVELWITYQAGILAPRTVVVPKAEATDERIRQAIRDDIAVQQAGGGIERFTL